MRRNVRRLNREVGGVVVAISGGKATATTKKFGEDVSGVVKKAANLSELKRYCKAAEEAAREVLVESQAAEATLGVLEGQQSSAGSDVQSLANIDETLPLKSPSRMVALQLANGNPSFREKLKKKLEDSGFNFEMDEATGVLGTLGANTVNNRKPLKNGKPPLASSTGIENDDRSKPSKMRQKRKASSDHSSIMRRRRKDDLEIAITGTAAQIHSGGPMMVGGTPFRSLGFGYGSGQPGTVSPLNVDKHVNFGDDIYGAGGLGSLGNLMGLPIGDTPGKGFLSDGGSSSSGQKDINSSGTPRFDFDEVVQGFPSPRGSAGGAVGGSPSRWSMGSSGSGSMFVFPDSKGKDHSRTSTGGEPPLPPTAINKEAGVAFEAGTMGGSITKRPLRMSGGRPGETPSPSALTLPSPMSALPSPTFADISASFLSNSDSLDTSGLASVSGSTKVAFAPRHSLEGGVLEPAVVSGSDGNCSDSGRSSNSSSSAGGSVVSTSFSSGQ